MERPVAACTADPAGQAWLPLRVVRLYLNPSAAVKLWCNGVRTGLPSLTSNASTQIRGFARRALAALAALGSGARSMLLTLHGADCGRDEVEVFDSEVAGLPDAAQQVLHLAGQTAVAKPHVFVAMPFAPGCDDLYHSGITGAVKTAGYFCERADLSAFTGDVVAWVQTRIASARLLVAELTGANPNVYLGVGDAWALRVPTVLLVQWAADLRFDVRGQRVIGYHGSIRTLEDKLARTPAALPGQDGAGAPLE